MTRPRVLVLGNTTADHVFRMSVPIVADAKLHSESYDLFPGGQAANVAVTLAFLGFDVVFVGAFGDDAGALLGREAFSAAGVDLSFSKSVSHCRHHTACILVTGVDRTIVMHRDPRLTLDDIVITRDMVAGCSAVYTDGHEGLASLRLAEIAATTSTPLVLDLEVVNPQTQQLARHGAHVIAPADILCTLTDVETAEGAVRALAESGPLAVVATIGAGGSLGSLAGSGAVLRAPAIPCAVVDTTGAGDAFHAGYLASLVGGASLKDRMQFGNVLAAAKCEVAGPRLGVEDCARLRS